MDEMVILIIKAANQSTPDQRMQCDANWSVSTLKGHLSEAHPSRPNTEEQRLIYSGQLLSDHHLLCNILRRPSEDNTYTIHLVCSPPPSSSSHRQTHRHSNNNNNNNNTDTNHEGPTSMAANTAPPTTTTNESTDGIRRRHPPASTAATTTTTTTTPTLDTSGPPPTTTTTPTLPLHAVEGMLQPSYDPIHQVAAMQQMYAQYMAYVQYSMQLSGGGLGGLAWPQQMIQIPPPPNPATATTAAATPPPPPPLPPPTTDTTDQPQQDLNQPPPPAVAAADPQPQPQQQQQQQQQQQPIRMNAQGGEVVDDEDEDEAAARDWLDWVYVLCRMMVLLSIVYFYSTLSRFMVVIFIAMLLYLYQAGWFRPTRRVELPANQPQPPHAPHNQQNNNNNNNNNNDEQGRASEDEEEDEEEGEEELEDEVPRMEDVLRAEGSEGDETRLVVRPSFLSLSWTFLTTFFTSLIPEQPQGI